MLVVGAILIFMAPLVHIYFPKKNQVVEDYKSQLELKTSLIDNQIEELRKQHYETNKTYFDQLDKLTALKKQTSESNKKLIKQKVDDNRFFGWKTKRSFLIGFGIRAPYLFFTIFISILIAQIKNTDKIFKVFLGFFQTALCGISLYVLVWCFWTTQDYPFDAYKYAILTTCVIVAIASVLFITHIELFKLRLQKIVDALSNFILGEGKEFIDPSKSTEYRKQNIKAFKKGLE